MIVYSHIGFWKDLIKETMPHSRFLLQEQRDDFFELEKASSLPSFITDRVLSEEPLKIGRLSRLWTNRPRLSTLLS